MEHDFTLEIRKDEFGGILLAVYLWITSTTITVKGRVSSLKKRPHGDRGLCKPI
jgi:hypothetical protein